MNNLLQFTVGMGLVILGFEILGVFRLPLKRKMLGIAFVALGYAIFY